MDEKSELEMKGTLRLSNAAALEKYAKERGQKNFQESPQNMYTWDYVMVFKVGDPKKTVKVKVKEKGKKKKSYEIKQDEYFRDVTASVVQKLRMAGLKTDLYYSVQKDEIYCRVAASERRLMEQASRIDYDLQLDKTNCLDYGRVIGVKLAKNTDLPGTKIKSEHWENLYGKYDMLDPLHPEVAFRQELYIRHNTVDPAHPRHNSLFSTVDRLRLTYTIIEAEELTGGAGLAPNKLIANQNHPLIACFPLHEEHVKQQLEKKWYHWTSTFKSPLPEIRGYFGESVAFYFAFLAFYNRALIAPAIIGLALFIWQMAVGRVDVEGVVPYAILISCWATLLIEYWKRREAKYRVRWGMTKFLEKEQPRPEFKGQWKPSPVDGKLTEIFPWHKKLIRALLSQTVIWTLIVVVIASVVSIFFFREVVKDYSWGIIVSAIINAIQIQILNFVYGVVARGLNSYENHRTDTEYENALISKTFLFKFINSYNSLYYIAFFKEYDNTVKGCLNDDCLKELQQQLGTIFISLIVIANTIEIGVPYIMQKKAERDNRAVDSDYHARQASLRSPASAENSNIALTDLEANVESDGRKRAQSIHYVENSQAEKEFELAAYEGTFDDFDEMVIQFGYVTLFVVAFPLAPLLALINNFIETRLDSTKLCKFSRRPEPKGAYNIGTWYDIINVLSYIAVITNALIICFQTKLMTDWAGGNKATKAYVFILSEHTVLLIKFAISYFVPDVPLELVVHEARQEYIVSVLIKGMEEDDDDDDENSKEKDDDEAEHTDKVEFDWEGIKEKCTEDPGHEHRSREEETPAGGAVSDAGVTSPSI